MGLNLSCKKFDPPLVTDLKGYDAGQAIAYKKNEIREIKITDKFSVLVSQDQGKFYGYGTKCPHYGAPLVKGAMVNGKVKCPWHGACFDIKTGEIEDCPGTVSIPTYQCEVKPGGHVWVYPENFGVYTIEKPLSRKIGRHRVVIMGAGAAGIVCAQTLRENGFDGQVVMLCQEEYLPYDRTKLSKSLGVDWKDIKIKPLEWFTEAQVDIQVNATVAVVNSKKQHVYFKDDPTPIHYDRLLCATGCRPRLPKNTKAGVLGCQVRNVVSLHKLRDAGKIKARAPGKNVVIMGGGFIAMELASILPAVARTVTVICRSKRPYGVVLGDTVGRIIQQHVIDKSNIIFLSCDEVKKVLEDGKGAEGGRGKVVEVITMKKRVIPCDLLIFAIGGVPNTEMFGDTDQTRQVKMLPSNHIVVDQYLETSVKDIYAAGDCAKIPLECSSTKFATVGHWGFAQKTGRIAAMNMLGHGLTIKDTIPFFWHNVAGLNIRYAGYGENYDESIIFGDLLSTKFCVLYRRDDKILACLTCNCDPIAAMISFDIKDDIIWNTAFPPYITKVFPEPPIVGDTLDGIRFDIMEERLAEFDVHTYRRRDLWVPRYPRQFHDNAYQDRYIKVPRKYTRPKKLINTNLILLPQSARGPPPEPFSWPDDDTAIRTRDQIIEDPDLDPTLIYDEARLKYLLPIIPTPFEAEYDKKRIDTLDRRAAK